MEEKKKEAFFCHVLQHTCWECFHSVHLLTTITVHCRHTLSALAEFSDVTNKQISCATFQTAWGNNIPIHEFELMRSEKIPEPIGGCSFPPLFSLAPVRSQVFIGSSLERIRMQENVRVTLGTLTHTLSNHNRMITGNCCLESGSCLG